MMKTWISKIPRPESIQLLIILLLSALFSTMACNSRVHEEMRRAAIKGQADTVRVLVSKGANVNYKHGGWTVLMFVAREGHTEVARILLENGADPNAKGRDGTSALTIAAEQGHVDIIKLLLTKGAYVNARNNQL